MRIVTLYTLAFLFMGACNAYPPETKPGQTKQNTLHDPVKSNENDSSSLPKEIVTQIYSQAIAAFIKAVDKKHKTRFDTLFFGKRAYGQPDDFPDIELPGTIANTCIKLVTPEMGLKKQEERRSLVYINMIGWVNKEKAEFILVTFSNGGDHQYDCFINYKYRAARKEFELENLRFEYFLYKDKQ